MPFPAGPSPASRPPRSDVEAPRFLPELARAPSGQRSPWLLSAAATSTEPAWPPCVAWHLERESGAQRARWALEEVYGPGKLMGWEENGDVFSCFYPCTFSLLEF